MKALRNISITRLIAIGLLLMVSCEETEKITLPEPTEFVSPTFLSPATAPAVEFLPEDADENYETLKWEVANYGINVSVRYEIQIDDNEDFDSPETLLVSEGNRNSTEREVIVTVKAMNDKMLALGVPGFQESTVYLRVRSSINGIPNDPLYSNTIERTATTYQTSECGNFCTVGIIGSASPGGWDADTDMRLLDATGVDRQTWTVTVYLIGGQEVKFRAQDSWDTNWGATGFPSGTGTLNGSNIPIPTTGYYRVLFNDATGQYTFTLISTTYTAMALIGDGVGGWGDSDEKQLTKDPTDPHIWTGMITFSAADVKFRANASWDSNWGSDTYPSGYGVGNGPNIPIPVGGTFFVWFNDASGEYFIGPTGNAAPYSEVGLIGPATPNGWGGPDHDIYKNPGNPYKWSRFVLLVDGEVKFRANDGWDVNWGASTFPSGVSVQNGANIPALGGTYFVTFNTLTGQYYFLK
jgi:hypothetical protein